MNATSGSRLLSILALFSALASADATARITKLELVASAPYGMFKPGAYVRLDVRLTGELIPSAERIPDLDKATRSAAGTVEYSTKVVLLMPVEPGQGNGALLVDVPNRGHSISSSLFNSPRQRALPVGSLDPGTGFLEDNGFTIAVVPWELGYGVDLPSFVGADGRPRFIEGAGLAIVRDVADFLAHASVDAAGQANPLAGRTRRTLAIGYSQTGRFLRTFLMDGFNVVDGRQVFSAMHVLGAASGYILLRSVPGPRSGAGALPTFADPEVRGVAEEPQAISEIVEQVAKRGEDLPRIVFVNTTTDYFSLRASLGRTGTSGVEERPLPSNVRMYDVAGASHALIVGPSECKYPFAILDWHPVMRSTLLALDHWVSGNASPPPSELMPLREAAQDSMALRAPAHLPKAVIEVPILDQDGNATGGVRLPDILVPVGTNAIQNPPLSFVCALGSGYVAFAKTKQDRDATGDQRLSLAERYKDHSDFSNKVRAAARDLERRGFLLSDDAAVIVESAAAASVPN